MCNRLKKLCEGHIFGVLSPEEFAREEQLVKEGKLLSSWEPSDDELEELQDMFRQRDCEAEEREAEIARLKYAAGLQNG